MIFFHKEKINIVKKKVKQSGKEILPYATWTRCPCSIGKDIKVVLKAAFG